VVKPCLLDVNVLIALLDANHIHHIRAMRWFRERAISGWLSSPITQNGVIRIMCRPGYAHPRFSPRDVADLLEALIRNSTHRFVPDDISMLDQSVVDLEAIRSHGDVTDTYLLALAKHHDAMLATMDMTLSPQAVPDSREFLLLIP
jgi:toxin-antitoxin system PIN domain toxin